MFAVAVISFVGTLILGLIAVGFVKLYEDHKLKKINKEKTEE